MQRRAPFSGRKGGRSASAGCQLLLANGGALPGILAEGLLIAGGVAMRRPIEIFLYDWWPIRQSAQMYGKLANVPVDVVSSVAGQSHASEPAKGG